MFVVYTTEGTPVYLVRAIEEAEGLAPGSLVLDEGGTLYQVNSRPQVGLSGFGSFFSAIGNGVLSFGKNFSSSGTSALQGYLNLGVGIGTTLLANRSAQAQQFTLQIPPQTPTYVSTPPQAVAAQPGGSDKTGLIVVTVIVALLLSR